MGKLNGKPGCDPLKGPNESHKRVRDTTKLERVLTLDLDGTSQKDIAPIVGLSVGSVKAIMKSPVYQNKWKAHWNKVRELQIQRSLNEDETRKVLKELAPTAAKKLERLVKHAKSETTQLLAVKDTLDRGGYVHNPTTYKATVQLTQEQADRFAKVLGVKETTPKQITLEKEMVVNG